MFFRRERPKHPSFQDRLENLRKAGFQLTSLPDGAVRISRGTCAVDLKQDRGTVHRQERAGILIGTEIGALVDGGYQKFWQTPTRKVPATAEQLTAMHKFQEALAAGLALGNLYNISLGTVSTNYHYDRVKGRGNP